MTSAACDVVPPVSGQNYEPKGAYATVGGHNTYVTGPENATSGIIDIYDIFGLSSPTLQGADLLAALTNSLVVVPDFFGGEPVKNEWLPADTDEKKALMAKFRSERAAIPENLESLLKVAEECKARFATAKKWAAFGLCWGGKVAVLASGLNSPFVVSGQTHPSQLDKADAENLTIPHIVLASNGEPADLIAAYNEIIGKNGIGGIVETYPSMWHGWMGGRAKLQENEAREEYTRGYKQAAEFFKQHLK